MKYRLVFLTDPLSQLHAYKDSTVAMMLEAQARGWEIHSTTLQGLFLENSQLFLTTQKIHLEDKAKDWFSLEEKETHPASFFHVIFMRKDPPFDTPYLHATYLLDHAVAAGTWVMNHPKALREYNEKMHTTWFPQCCVSSLVSQEASHLRKFIREEKDVILKPLDAMGGELIFRVKETEPNLSVILETITQRGTEYVMAQQYIPDIAKGDKRILMVNGEPIPYALARLPAPGETRGNLAAGGKPQAQPLSERDLWICKELGPSLREKGLFFVGLDVIGDYLTEINITSPTCIRELHKETGLNAASILLDAMALQLNHQRL